jgi:hypothetical protein
MNTLLINKHDFSTHVQFTANIDERLVNFHISDAQTFDLANALPNELIQKLKDYTEQNPDSWNRTTPYAVNHVVKHEDVYYKAVATSTGSKPSSANTNWKEVEAMSFFINFVKPFLVCAAYYRFLNWHGANVTQFGIRQINEDTSNEVSEGRRGELMADINNKKQHYLSLMLKRFSDVAYTFDEVKYETTDCNTPARSVAGIYALGGKNLK